MRSLALKGLVWGSAVPALLATLLLVVSGLVIRVNAWTAAGLFERSLLDASLSVHRLAALPLGPLVFAILCALRLREVEVPSSWRLGLAWAGTLILALALPAISSLLNPEPGYVETNPLPIVVGVGCGALSLAHWRRDLTALVMWLLVASQIVVGVQALLVPGLWSSGLFGFMTGLTLLALSACLQPFFVGIQQVPLGIALFAMGSSSLALWLNIPEEILWLQRVSVLGFVTLLGLAALAAIRSPRSAFERSAALGAVLAIGPTFSLEGLGWGRDAMLADTLFDVGLLHLQVVGIACAVLAIVSRPKQVPTPVLGALGFFVAGGLNFGWVMVALGLSGMPTRYYSYEGPSELLHRMCTASAFVALIGLVAVSGALVFAKRSGAPSTEKV